MHQKPLNLFRAETLIYQKIWPGAEKFTQEPANENEDETVTNFQVKKHIT